MNTVLAIIGLIAFCFLLGLWFKMIADAFTYQPTETKAGWIIFLLFANYPAAIYYYFSQYRPRLKKATLNNKIIAKELKQVSTTIKNNFCSNCGAKLDSKPNFCPACGNKVKG